MKFAICTFASIAAVANAQLQNIPGRLRSSSSANEWGRQRRTQMQRSLESSMSFSMPEIDASISMPSFDSSVSMSMSMAGDMDWAVPDEPEIILDEAVVVVESSVPLEEVGSEIATDEEDFIDGEFEEMKLE
jgi:hypothetical protein